MNRILLPTDFSELAEHALRYSLDLAKSYKAELHVLHVVSPAKEMPAPGTGPIGVQAGGILVMEGMDRLTKTRAAQLKQLVVELAHDQPVAPITVVRMGTPWMEIVGYANDAKIDCVVIGTHAKGIMQRILLGSTSKAVLEHIACAVLMVPVAAVEKAREESLCSASGVTPRPD